MAHAAGWGILSTPRRSWSGRVNVAAPETLWRRLQLAIDGRAPADPAPANPQGTAAREEIGVFEPFFRAHQRDIFTYLWRMTGDEQAAYDLTQETFLRAWRNFARVRDYERPGGWLFRVATHLALNHLRGRKSMLGSAVSLDASSISPFVATADHAASVADADAVRRALMAVAPRHRAALALREVYGLSCAEVAVALGVSTGAAKTLLWRARDEFRSRYAEEARS